MSSLTISLCVADIFKLSVSVLQQRTDCLGKLWGVGGGGGGINNCMLTQLHPPPWFLEQAHTRLPAKRYRPMGNR